jgi:hypothetical protein
MVKVDILFELLGRSIGLESDLRDVSLKFACF